MAFCTKCGATVPGAFCQQCGTPSSAAAAQPAAPQSAPQYAPQYAPQAPPQQAYQAGTPMAPAPAKGKISPIVWVLLILVGVVVLGIVGVVGAGLYVAHRVAQNPGLMMAKILTAANPDAEVISTDPSSQTMRIRDKKTGEEVTISFDDLKRGRFKFSARGSNGEMANVEIGGNAKLPSWVPAYPDAKAQGNIRAQGDSGDGGGEGGVATFTTADTPRKVMDYYEGKCRAMGATVNLAEAGDAGGMFTCEDEGGKRTLHVMVGGGSGDGETSFTLTYGRKR